MGVDVDPWGSSGFGPPWPHAVAARASAARLASNPEQDLCGQHGSMKREVFIGGHLRATDSARHLLTVSDALGSAGSLTATGSHRGIGGIGLVASERQLPQLHGDRELPRR